MAAYANDDIEGAGHHFQRALFLARTVKKGDELLQKPRRGILPIFAATIHHDIRGFNAILSNNSEDLTLAGEMAINAGHAEGLAAVGARIKLSPGPWILPATSPALRVLGRQALLSGNSALVGALWGSVSVKHREAFLNPLLSQIIIRQHCEQPAPENTFQVMAKAAYRATWRSEPVEARTESLS